MTTQHSRFESKRQQEDTNAVDTGLIRCVCTSTEDDGFTIQCERCLIWQHAYCVQITHASIPDHYLCDQCSKRKRPKLSKRIPISKNKLRKLDAKDDPSFNTKKKKHVKSRIVSRYVHAIFREAKDRWSRWKQQDGHLLYDHGPFVTMDAVTLFIKGVLIDTPVSSQGLFANRPIPALRYLMQVTGDVMLKSEFKFDPINDFVLLGTPLSHIMFYPSLDLCIDTRQFGNKARYIRRSCHPNAELRNVVLPRDDKTIHLGLFARHLIEKGQQVTISWGWQRGHIAWKENMNWHHQHKLKGGQDEGGHQVIDEEEERRRKATIKTMLDRFEKEFGSCACLNKRRCLIEHLRRQIAPPKEKPVFKLPAVNILPLHSRRKSEIILLKPKSPKEIVKGTEENNLIDVTSNSPTLNAAKETSDDELLDVEGDIDVGDDLPTKDALPLLEDNSSDEEHADLSSLSSLSSLSVFEESGDNSDDEENRSRARRKKQSRHGKRSHHNASSSSAPITSSTLPRKKLWMRDYLNKHISDVPPDDYTNDTTMDIDTRMRLFNSDRALVDATPEDIEAAKLLLDAMAANEIPYIHHPIMTEHRAVTFDVNNSTLDVNNSTLDVNNSTLDASNPTLDASNPSLDTINPTFDANNSTLDANNSIFDANTSTFDANTSTFDANTSTFDANTSTFDANTSTFNTFDVDEGELSDASTILLDQDEILQAYRRESMDLRESVTVHTLIPTESLIAKTPLPILHEEPSQVGLSKDSHSKKLVEKERPIEHTRVDKVLVNEGRADETNAVHKLAVDTMHASKRADEPVSNKPIVEIKEEKKPVRKISLQEYLYKQQQKSINK